MTKTSGLATSALSWAALAAALLAAGCAASKEALLPPSMEMAHAAEIAPAPVEPAAEPQPTSIAALGLRGASPSAAPAGGVSLASAGRADAENAASDITISYPPADEDGLDALLTTLAAAQPAAAEPVIEAPAAVEPAMAMVEPEPAPAPQAGSADEAFEMTALVASPFYPLTPAEPVRESRTAPAHSEASAVQPATTPEPVAVTLSEPVPELAIEPAPMTLAAVDTAMTMPVSAPDTAPEPAPASSGLQRLEDFYSCDYAPAQRRGNVELVTCQ